MVIPSLIAEFLKERVEDNLSLIRYLSRDIGEMNRFREMCQEDWESEEIIRHIIFMENENIQDLRREIERDRKTIREYGKRRTAEGPTGI